MSAAPNPFPAYPVATLSPHGEEPSELTVTTPGIAKAERLIDAYVEQFADEGSAAGVNVAIRGEFGTGKTHLLAHVERHGRLRSGEIGRDIGAVILGAMESDPVAWYRAMVGPRVGRLNLEGLATALYARVATIVAGRAPLTAAAARPLEEDPASVHALLEDQLLSSSSVDRELISTLERIAPDARRSVLAAIEGLISKPGSSLRWLEGERLSEREAVASGLSESLESDQEAADVLVVLAAIHRELGRPFMLVVDELEHLVHFDQGQESKTNVTWLKRLLERLEREGAAVFVAGHTSAWVGHPDFLERFSPNGAIELEPLSIEDVVRVVARFARGATSFTEADAALVDRSCEGNIRRTLGMLHLLYERSDGFNAPIPEQAVAEVAAAATHQVDPEQAIDDLGHVLRGLGLRVSRRAAISDLTFDLVAYRDDLPVLIVESKHALFGRKQQEQAQRFVDKLRVVNRRSPSCVGIFASSGVVDPGLLEIDLSAAQVHWFDLTRPDFVASVQRTVEPVLRTAPSPEAGSDRDAALSTVVEEIQAVKDAQAADYARLEDRLTKPAGAPSNLEFRAPARSDTQDERRAIFEELSRRPSALRQFGLIRGSRLLMAVVFFVIGISLITQASPLAESFVGYGSFTGVRVLLFVCGAVTLVVSVAFLAREFMLIDRFFAFKRERLRDLYVLEAPIETLIETSRIADYALNGFGPYGAIEQTALRLERAGLVPEHALGEIDVDSG